MLSAVENMLRTQCRVLPGASLLVAVSGGADSVALLSLLRRLADDFPLRLVAAHLDHGLRKESPVDAAFVGDLCAAWGIHLVLGQADVRGMAKENHWGIEEAARVARRDFLEKTALRMGCEAIALGHHLDDQGETFLHRLIRGTGVSGLAAMQPRTGMYIRPLLNLDRNAIRDYVAAEGLPFVEDASNVDLRFTRNRIRHELLPQIQTYNPRVVEHLARLASRIGDEESYWRQEVENVLSHCGELSDGGMWLDRKYLMGVHPALRMRVFRQVLATLRGQVQGISSRHLEAVEAQLLSSTPQTDLSLPHAWSCRRYELLWLGVEPLRPEVPQDILIDGPGDYPLPQGGVINVCLAEACAGESLRQVEFDASTIRFPLRVRTYAPGDRFRPSGMTGRKKIKDFFVDEKIPREERSRIALVEAVEIIWVVGMRRCEGFRPGAGGGPVLRLSLKGEEFLTNGL